MFVVGVDVVLCECRFEILLLFSVLGGVVVVVGGGHLRMEDAMSLKSKRLRFSTESVT